MLIYLISIIILSIVMALATNVVISSTRKISSITGFKKYALATLVLAMGTSLPELLVAIQSAIKNQAPLALGSVLGSNIADLSIIIGGATIIGGNLKINKNILKNDIFYSFLISATPLLLLIDGRLGRAEALVLLALLSLWQVSLLRKKRTEANLQKANPQKESAFETFKQRLNNKRIKRLMAIMARLTIGLVVMLTASHYLIGNAHVLAVNFKISAMLIGIFLIGLGTSLPELALESRAIKNKEYEVALGDLLGSVVINSSLILGITALIRPIIISQPRLYLVTTIFFLLTFSVFYLFIRTKSVLERWEGAILLMLYFLMVAVELV